MKHTLKKDDYVFFSKHLSQNQYHNGQGFVVGVRSDGCIEVAVEDILADDGSWRIMLNADECLGTIDTARELLVKAYKSLQSCGEWSEISSVAEAAILLLDMPRKKALRFIRVAFETCDLPFEFATHLLRNGSRKRWDNGTPIIGGITRGFLKRNYKSVRLQPEHSKSEG